MPFEPSLRLPKSRNSQMSFTPDSRVIDHCASCRQPLDVSNLIPLTDVTCPHCQQTHSILRSFGGFELEKVLGKGGMGYVYRARDRALNRIVALKVLQKELSSNVEIVSNFEREATQTARINHQNVVRVFSTGVQHGMFYIAMELVDRGSLDDLMSTVGPMPEAQVLAIGIHIAEGLDAAHRVGLVHRDVKPGNILFSAENVAKIVDFGLAVPADQARNQQGELWATPFYVAPEKLEKRFEDYRSDMYSLGATLFHALTGQPPHPQETASIPELLQAKKAKVDLRKVKREAHPASVELLNKMLEFSSAKRHQTYNELLVDLRAALAMVTTGVRPNPGMSPSTPTLPSNVAAEIRRRKRFPWFSTIAALGIVSSAAFLFLHPKGKALVDDTLKRLTKGPQGKGQGTYAGKDPSTQLALDGKFAEAAESLNPILADAKLPAGAKLRFSLKQALLLIFAQDSDSAIKVLKSLADWTQTAAGAAASPSIVDVRKSIESAIRRQPVKAASIEISPNDSAFIVPILAFYHLPKADFTEAERVLARLDPTKTPGIPAWIAELAPVYQTFRSDLQKLLKSDIAIKAVKADSKQVEKLDAAEKDLQTIKFLRTEKDALLADLRTTKAAAIEANKPPPPVEPLHPSGKTLAEAADMDKIQDLIQSVRPKMMEFDVEGVKKIIDEQPEFRTEYGKTCYAGMKIAAGEALKFKDVLISDINSSPNVPGILLRTGAPVKGAPAKANVNQVLFNTPLGDITLPWSQLQPESLTKAAVSKLNNAKTGKERGMRLLILGCYHAFCVDTEGARPHLNDAVRFDPASKPTVEAILPLKAKKK